MGKGFGLAVAGAFLGGVAGYGKGLAESGANKRAAVLELLKTDRAIGLENLRSTNRMKELTETSRLTGERSIASDLRLSERQEAAGGRTSGDITLRSDLTGGREAAAGGRTTKNIQLRSDLTGGREAAAGGRTTANIEHRGLIRSGQIELTSKLAGERSIAEAKLRHINEILKIRESASLTKDADERKARTKHKNEIAQLREKAKLADKLDAKKTARGLIDTKNLVRGTDGQLYVIQKNPGGKPTIIPLGIEGRTLSGKSEKPVEVGDPNNPGATIMVTPTQALGMPGKTGAKDLAEARRGEEEADRIYDRREAERRASDRAGYLNTDAADFSETGGDRETWITKEALRIGRARRAEAKASTDTKPKGSPGAKPKTREATTGQGKVFTLEEIKGMGRDKLKVGMKARARDGKFYVWDGKEFQPESN